MSSMDQGDDGGEFTFSVAAPLALAAGGVGVLFPCSSRRIVAARQYPVFGQPRSPPRRGAPEPGTMAAQSPAPRCRKSGSTGSAVLRLVGLGRSHSDGKHKFSSSTPAAAAPSARRGAVAAAMLPGAITRRPVPPAVAAAMAGGGGRSSRTSRTSSGSSPAPPRSGGPITRSNYRPPFFPTVLSYRSHSLQTW